MYDYGLKQIDFDIYDILTGFLKLGLMYVYCSISTFGHNVFVHNDHFDSTHMNTNTIIIDTLYTNIVQSKDMYLYYYIILYHLET